VVGIRDYEMPQCCTECIFWRKQLERDEEDGWHYTVDKCFFLERKWRIKDAYVFRDESCPLVRIESYSEIESKEIESC